MSDNRDIGQDFAQRVKDVLSLYVGEPHERKRFTRAALADASGIGGPALKTYCHGEHAPSGQALLRLIASLPIEAGNMLIAPTGYKLVPLTASEKNWLALAEKAARFAAKVIHYQSTNGYIDHTEDADLLRDARELAAEATVG